MTPTPIINRSPTSEPLPALVTCTLSPVRGCGLFLSAQSSCDPRREKSCENVEIRGSFDASVPASMSTKSRDGLSCLSREATTQSVRPPPSMM